MAFPPPRPINQKSPDQGLAGAEAKKGTEVQGLGPPREVLAVACVTRLTTSGCFWAPFWALRPHMRPRPKPYAAPMLNTVDLAGLFVMVVLLSLSAVLVTLIVVFFLERDWGRGNEEAEQKARALLRRWLSPAQLEQYEKIGHFEVLGSVVVSVIAFTRILR